jgi:hypothetical protein
MTEGILAVAVLFLIAGGGIIVIDALIIRRLRRQAKSRRDEP